jgi:hypothetical protein
MQRARTSNPDGTTTIVEQFTGGHVLYAEDGSVLARQQGNHRVELTFDQNGELVSFRVLKESGLNPDDCAVIEQAIG